ncbi:zinc-ribbon domain-containing protein [Kribbella sp. NPDC051620]|uniref:zinc-ribbon domain-containing protein n=1 Tax=Kribbella sp. NPDC051620 TaxID=3364120 RepID=UPI0037B044E5
MHCSDKALLDQWDSESKDLTPDDFSVGSSKRVLWRCVEAEDHRWPASIDKRVAGSNCPFCSGKRVSSTNCLSVHRPDIAAPLTTTTLLGQPQSADALAVGFAVDRAVQAAVSHTAPYKNSGRRQN